MQQNTFVYLFCRVSRAPAEALSQEWACDNPSAPFSKESPWSCLNSLVISRCVALMGSPRTHGRGLTSSSPAYPLYWLTRRSHSGGVICWHFDWVSVKVRMRPLLHEHRLKNSAKPGSIRVLRLKLS